MSFAKDNWEEFEKLSISILETYLPVNSEISYSITHTPNRKDGGYDGLIIISSDNENIDQYKILSESKLRELSNNCFMDHITFNQNTFMGSNFLKTQLNNCKIQGGEMISSTLEFAEFRNTYFEKFKIGKFVHGIF